MKFRKKPVVVEAAQWFKDGDHSAVRAIAKGHTGLYVTEGWQETYRERGFPYGVDYVLDTANGAVKIQSGDWIVQQELNGKIDYWPIKPNIFAATHEPVEAEAVRQEPT
jgi:hypothetical protein